MSRLPVRSVDSAPEASRDALKVLEARVGRVLNLYGGIAHSPAVLHADAAVNEAITEHSSLDAATREAIALAVGAVNDCGYCQAAHTLVGRGAGLGDDQMLQIRRGDIEGDGRLAAIVAVAREAATDVGAVSDATWQAALEAGWSDTELGDAFASVAANLFTNYFNHFAGTELDLPPAPGTAT
ncbi:MAG: carboxymuconolactone decarboxylase family protein [Acidimicrobiales bacterium]